MYDIQMVRNYRSGQTEIKPKTDAARRWLVRNMEWSGLDPLFVRTEHADELENFFRNGGLSVDRV